MSKNQKVVKEEVHEIPQAPFNYDKNEAWWTYRKFTPQQREQVTDFLKHLHEDQVLLPNLYENMKKLPHLIGWLTHPAFKTSPEIKVPIIQNNEQEEEKKEPELQVSIKEDQFEIQSEEKLTFLILNNIKIDWCTMSLLTYALKPTKIRTIKLSHNQLDEETLNELLDYLASPDSKIQRFFCEWNYLPDISNKLYPRIGLSQSIEFLVLRALNLDDEAIDSLFDNLTLSAQIKFIDLYNNNFGKKGLQAIGAFLEENRTLEYLGLANNQISSFEEILPIAKAINRKVLTPQEVEEHREKERERDAIIEKNKKLRAQKKAEEHVPVLDPVEEIQGGNLMMWKNTKLYMLNLSLNKFDDTSATGIEKLLTNTKDTLQVVLHDNKFEEKNKEKLRKKFPKKILI